MVAAENVVANVLDEGVQVVDGPGILQRHAGEALAAWVIELRGEGVGVAETEALHDVEVEERSGHQERGPCCDPHCRLFVRDTSRIFCTN